MSNRTYICINCRTAKRAEAEYGLANDMRCSICRQELWELDHKWRIPKKDDDKEWKKLEEKVKMDKENWSKRKEQIKAQKITEINKKIQNIEKQKESESKNKKLKQLKTNLKEIETKYKS
jgi:DNA repair exonuclease SbcCD ATPase subunit